MLIALQGHLTIISSKVRKLRRQQERLCQLQCLQPGFFLLLNSWSIAGQTMMTEPEKSSDLGELSAVMYVRLGVG